MSDTLHPPAVTPEPDAPRAPLSMPGAERVIEAIMFTDIEKSVELQQALGTERYAEVLTRHGELFYEALGTANSGHVEKHTGDGFMVRFSLASDAVAAALRFQWLLRREQWNIPDRVRVRVGIHQGEILLLQAVRQMPGSVGTPVNLAARVMSMAEGGQILLTRAVFDSARQFIREIPGIPASASVVLGWEAHGAYVVRGMENPVEIFEVGERGRARFTRPASNAAAQRVVSAEDEATLGWRPARAMEVPKRPGWFLQRRIGEGGFGEVWVAENHRTHEPRVFKFCFDAVRLRSFKRELALFRFISKELGPRPDIATLYEVQLESAPFFLESEFCPGGTLKDWLERKEAAGGAPLSTRLAIVARVARALAAAHSVGVIHKDVKPSNIFIEERSDGEVRPLLADFGIGTVANLEVVANLDISFGGDLTMVGDLSRTGTRLYSPPEYLVGSPASILGDIYSLGVLLYQVVIGNFEQPLGDGWQRRVPDKLLADDIANCVDGDPERRFSSALQLAEQLESIEQRRAQQRAAEDAKIQKADQLRELARHRRRVRIAWASAAAALLLLGVLSIVLFVEHRRRTDTQRHAADALAGRELAEGRLYVADMQAATDDLVQERAEAARELINRHLPKAGERDRRGWEWFFADSVLNTAHLARPVSKLPLRGLAVSPDRTQLAITGDDGEVSLWSCDTFEKLRAWRVGQTAIRCTAWSDTGILATGLANGEVALWETATGREQARWKAHEGGVTGMDWHRAKPVLATGGADGRIVRWQADGTFVDSVQKRGAIQALAWRDGTDELAVVFGRPGRLVAGNLATIAADHSYALGVEESAIAWRPGAFEVAVAMKDLPMRSWNPYTCVDSFHLTSQSNSGASAYAWSPRGHAVAVGGVDGRITLVDANRLAESRPALHGHARRITGMQWLGGSAERLLSVGEDGFLRVWEHLDRSPEIAAVKFAAPISDARWHPRENRLAVLLAGDEVRVLDGASWRTVWSRPLAAPLEARSYYSGGRLAWNPDGRLLAAVCAGRPPAVWDFEKGKMTIFLGFEDAAEVQWMEGDRRLLFRTSKGWSWAAVDGSGSARLPGTEDAEWVAALEGDRVGMVKPVAGVRSYVAASGAAVELPTGLAPLRCAALSADRSLLALAGESGSVAWIETHTGRIHRPALAHAGPVKALGWHPSGTRLASVGADGSCRIFNIAQATQNWVIDHGLNPNAVAAGWNFDGSKLLLASGPAKTAKIFDAAASLVTHGLRGREIVSQLPETITTLDAIAQQPGEDFGWNELERALKTRRASEAEADVGLLQAAARLGAQSRFDPLDDEPPKAAALLTTWRGAALPPAVQAAQACALRHWDAVLSLTEGVAADSSDAEWMALARAEAFAQSGRRLESEASNLTAWRALRRLHGAPDNTLTPRAAPEGDSTTVDLRSYANIKLTDDWNGSENNNLSKLEALVTQREGFSFHCADFIQLAGKGLRRYDSTMLPRSTGWIALPRPAAAISFLLAACYIDVNEPLRDTCVGSIYLLRRDNTRAVRIPLIYGRNIWDWWTPPLGGVSEAPPAAVAWTGTNPHAQSKGHNLALYRVGWTDLPDETPVVAISFVSHVRRPAPFLVAAELRETAER